jgi:hypothetical protein
LQFVSIILCTSSFFYEPLTLTDSDFSEFAFPNKLTIFKISTINFLQALNKKKKENKEANVENLRSLALPQISQFPLDFEIVKLIESELSIVEQIIINFEKAQTIKIQKAEKRQFLADKLLLIEAIKGISNLFFGAIEYFSIWFAFYPLLLFTSSFLFKKFFLCSFPGQLKLCFLYQGGIAGLLGIYFFSKLFIPYVTTQTEIFHFTANRENLRFNIFVYSLITLLILIKMNLLASFSTFFNDGFWQSFRIFFTLYLTSVFFLKCYFQHLFTPN